MTQGQNGLQGLDIFGNGKSILQPTSKSSGESDIGGREGNIFCHRWRVLAYPSFSHQELCSCIASLSPSSTRDKKTGKNHDRRDVG